MEKEKIENVGRARERGNIGFYYEILLGVLLHSKSKMRRAEGEKEKKYFTQFVIGVLDVWCEM